MPTRRVFLQALTAAAVGSCVRQGRAAASVQTVTGPVTPDALGVTLPHEHVLVDFVGAAQVSRDRYDADAAFAKALPHLRRLRELGCRTLVECTPAYIGRDPQLLKRLAEASGLLLLTNAGYYGAADDKFVPAHAYEETADQLAARWVREAREGIEATTIRPAFMKIGVDSGPLSEIDAKLVVAAARTHRATGLPIWSHTGDGIAARAQLDLLAGERLPLESFVWVHAQNERDTSVHEAAAGRGAWVEFDGLSDRSFDRHIELVRHMHRRGLLGRVLVSHDAGWFHVGEPGGGTYRPHDLLFTRFLPELRTQGFTEADVRQLTIENPRAALTPPAA